jgi:hypothetical protein
VSDEKTNMCKPLLTHRKNYEGIETGGCGYPRDNDAAWSRPESGSYLHVALVVSGV